MIALASHFSSGDVLLYTKPTCQQFSTLLTGDVLWSMWLVQLLCLLHSHKMTWVYWYVRLLKKIPVYNLFISTDYVIVVSAHSSFLKQVIYGLMHVM